MVNFNFIAQDAILSPTDLVRRNEITKSVSFGPMEKEVKLDIPTVVNDNIEILNKIPLPKNIQKSDLERIIEKIIKEDLEKDPLFKVSLDLAKYANDFHNKFTLYFSKIFSFHEEVMKRLDKELFYCSSLFLNSDLSPSFMKSLAMSILTEIKLIEVVDWRMRREARQLLAVKNNDIKFGRIVDAHNAWVNPLIETCDNMVKDRIALLWYLDFQNSELTEKIFEPKFISKKNLDQETFYSLIFSLQKSTQQLRKILANYNKEVFLSPIPTENPTFKLFSSMLQLALHA